MESLRHEISRFPWPTPDSHLHSVNLLQDSVTERGSSGALAKKHADRREQRVATPFEMQKMRSAWNFYILPDGSGNSRQEPVRIRVGRNAVPFTAHDEHGTLQIFGFPGKLAGPGGKYIGCRTGRYLYCRRRALLRFGIARKIGRSPNFEFRFYQDRR